MQTDARAAASERISSRAQLAFIALAVAAVVCAASQNSHFAGTARRSPCDSRSPAGRRARTHTHERRKLLLLITLVIIAV